MTKRFGLGCFVGALLMLSAQTAYSQQGVPAQAPGQALSQFPNGGPSMVNQVQALINANRANLAAIIEFAKTATEDQRRAIAQGLANVAKETAANDPGFATQIQQ